MNRLTRPIVNLLLLLALSALPSRAQETIEINANAPTTPFPHFWEEMFGSGRAALVLRQSYLNDLKAVKQVTDFRYVRFHAILHDELGVYNEDEHGNPVYNFAYVDQIYDNLLANGVRPVVEISFMPKKLAFNPDFLHPFWYKPNVSPHQVLRKSGTASSPPSQKISSTATASTRSPSGTSKSGTSPTSTSGAASRVSAATSSSTTTPRATSKP